MFVTIGNKIVTVHKLFLDGLQLQFWQCSELMSAAATALS